MANTFDILDAIQKVKKEPSSPPTKSSSEILSELFGKFNAEPPEISADFTEKKSKKKKKHKEKKKKKSDKRGRSSSDLSDDETEPVKKKLKKSKHKKKKKKSRNSDDESEVKYTKKISKSPSYLGDDKEVYKFSERKVTIEKTNFTIQVKSEKHTNSINVMDNIPIPKTPDVSQIKLPDENKHTSKTITNNCNHNNVKTNDKHDKTKTANKIQIKNLKFSSVYEATVKQAEEEARKKAEKYEDGELSESSQSNNSFKDLSDEDFGIGKTKTTDLREKLNDAKNSELEKQKAPIDNSKYEKSTLGKKSKRSRSKSPTRSTSKSKKRSRSRSRKRSRSRSKKRGHSRSRSRSHGKSHKRSRSRSRHKHYSSSRHHSKDGRRHSRYDRRRSSERDSRIEIDKKRLLEIARKNAINMLQSGALPAAINLGPIAQQKVISAIKSGGKSVDELTDFCKSLSRQEALGELSSVSSDSENSGNEESRPFNHPFQVKDKAPIVLNIKGGTALPTQSLQEKTIEQSKVLRMQFPVSSGTQHRGAEGEWRPVSPPAATVKSITIPLLPKHVPNPPLVKPQKTVPTTPATTSSQSTEQPPNPVVIPQGPSFVPPLPSTVPGMVQPPIIPAIPPGPQIFPADTNDMNIDIGSIVSQRLTAIRKLQQNPNDSGAINQMYQANQEMSKWAQSKQEPGQFTGSTGAQILTPRELASGYQAWAKRDQLQTAAPVSGGMGMHLLQKMGWKPGEGLGKEKNGALTPLLLEVKLDTRGLVAKEETKRPNTKRGPVLKTLSGKHPVSLLGEFCSKRKLGVPSYALCFECGPDHKKNFVFKVTVNGVEYQPNVASANKKQAKADAAQLCLQKLGVIPS